MNNASNDRVAIAPSRGDAEETDLERRVLAHERILQTLIAHLAERDARFIDRLSAAFCDTSLLDRHEHDYTDTNAYANQFLLRVRGHLGRETEPEREADVASTVRGGVQADDRTSLPLDSPVIRLEVYLARGIWSVTKGGAFLGHYMNDQQAFAAAESAAEHIVAGGGMADIVWSEASTSDPVSPGDDPEHRAQHTLEFRAGSTRVLRPATVHVDAPGGNERAR